MKQLFIFCALLTILSISEPACSQLSVTNKDFTRQDSLRGSLGPGRTWWDVKKYSISVKVDIVNQVIEGSNEIIFDVLKQGKNAMMQIDLQTPMEIEKIEYIQQQHALLPFKKDGNVWWVDFSAIEFSETNSKSQSLLIHYKGKPRVAKTPPWDGGWVWTKDAKGRPWVTVACQGLGASVWYPCKDHQSDEPDMGASLSITVPDTLVAVGNGRLKDKRDNGDGTITWNWGVVNPINSYNIVPYIGKYVNWTEAFDGEKGKLDCSYWVLDYNLEKAKKQFGANVAPMLKCFESWFGPYPFYEDSYKLVESSHLGMEHQSAVAYGNKFQNGYLGYDLSGSGHGMQWDYIIVHESGHEWFANNITSRDIADMWVHEGFTDYAEVLFVECQQGKKAADEYDQGLRRSIGNDRPVIGPYGVNEEGSGDMYAKGANLLHTIRQVIDDEPKFKAILRGLNKDFYHRVVDSKEVEEYISKNSGKDLSLIFNQYLRTTKIPVLEYSIAANKSKVAGYKLSFRWSNTVDGFAMPVRLLVDGKPTWIKPTKTLQSIAIAGTAPDQAPVDKNFYITLKKLPG